MLLHTIIDMMRLDYDREVNHHGQVRKVGNDSKGMEWKLLKTLQKGQQTKALSAQSQTTPFIVFADWRLQGRAGIGPSILIKFGGMWEEHFYDVFDRESSRNKKS